MKRKYLIGILLFVNLLAIGTLSPAFADTNPDDNFDDEAKTASSPWEIVLSTTHYDIAEWAISFDGSQGWSQDMYILRDWPGGVLQIHIFDRFWYGDFYGVYLIDPTAGTIIRTIGISPEVETDWHHGGTCPDCGVKLPCPVSDPMHTGTGNVYSEAWFDPWLDAGTHYFKVRNEFFHVLAAERFDPSTYPGDLHDPACRHHGYDWSPAGFYIGWHYTWQVPEFGFSVPTVTAIAAAIFVVIRRKFPKKVY